MSAQRITPQRFAALAVVGLSLVGVGCGSSSSGGGESAASSMSANELIEAAAKATKGSKSVRVNVHVTGSQQTEVEILNVPGKGVQGKIVTKGKTAEFVLVGGDFYIKGGEALYSSAGGAAALLKGKWLKIPASTAQAGGLNQVENLADLLNQNLSKLKGQDSHLTKTGEKTIEGKKVVGLTGTQNGQKGTVYVEAESPHYPVALEAGAPGGGTAKATFSGWNENTKVKAPANSVDLSSIVGG